MKISRSLIYYISHMEQKAWLLIVLAIMTIFIVTLACPSRGYEGFENGDYEGDEPPKKKGNVLKKVQRAVKKTGKVVKQKTINLTKKVKKGSDRKATGSKKLFKIETMIRVKKQAKGVDIYAPRRMVCTQNLSGFQCLYA
jgi:hypothetical protein